MELQSLRTFIQVAEVNSFTKAANRLGFSQPTVSFQIKQLENELGVQLFGRVGHTIKLTEAGRQVLVKAQHICRMTTELSSMNGTSEELSGVIRIAMADSLCLPLIINEFSGFRERFPQICLKVTTAGTDDMFRLLEHNEVDIVCTLDNHIYDNAYIIAAEEKVGAHFVCSAENSLNNMENLTIEDLLKQPFILTEKGMSYRRILDECMAAMSQEIEPVLEIGSADLICRLVEENAGVSFLPDYVTESAVNAGIIVRLTVQNIEVELWKQLLYHRDKWISPQMEAVLKYLSY